MFLKMEIQSTSSRNKTPTVDKSEAGQKSNCNEREIKLLDKFCQPCMTVDKNEKEAPAFCVGCVEFLCTNCVVEHQKNKQTRNHIILEGDDMPKDSKMFEAMRTLMTCEVHPETEVSYKCLDHDSFICVKCVTSKHKTCGKIEHISEIALNTEDLVRRLEEEDVDIKALLSMKHENVSHIANERKCIEMEVKEFVETINKHKLNLIEEFQTRTETIVKTALLELQNDIGRCTDIAKQEKYYQDLLKTSVNHGTQMENVTICEFIQKNLQRLNIEVKELSQRNQTCLHFEPTTRFESISSFGDISVIHYDQKEAACKLKIEMSSDTEVERQPEYLTPEASNKHSSENLSKETVAQAKKTTGDLKKTIGSFMSRPTSKMSTCKVRTLCDKQVCSVNGMATVQGQCYVLIDRGNKKIKSLGNDFSVSSAVALSEIPIDICKAGDTTFAVLAENRKLFIYDIHSTSVSLSASYDTKWQGLSITCNTKKQDILIVSSKEEKEVADGNHIGEILTLPLHKCGVVKRKTDRFQTTTGHKDSLPISTSIHFTPGKLFVSNTKRVHCLNITDSGTLVEQWYYKDHGMNHLQGVTDIDTDSDGNIYVCGKTSRNIHQVSGKRYWDSRVLISKLTDPVSVCVNSRNGLLLIGCENDDYIHVYQFR